MSEQASGGGTIPEQSPKGKLPRGWTLQRPASICHGGNACTDPEQWALTVAQFDIFLQACKQTALWSHLKQDTAWGKLKGHVNAYQICKEFTEPWTEGTGSSVSLLLNPELPKTATVMVSHSWAEDMHQVQTVLSHEVQQKRLTPDTAIWFCVFSICTYTPSS